METMLKNNYDFSNVVVKFCEIFMGLTIQANLMWHNERQGTVLCLLSHTLTLVN